MDVDATALSNAELNADCPAGWVEGPATAFPLACSHGFGRGGSEDDMMSGDVRTYDGVESTRQIAILRTYSGPGPHTAIDLGRRFHHFCFWFFPQARPILYY